MRNKTSRRSNLSGKCLGSLVNLSYWLVIASFLVAFLMSEILVAALTVPVTKDVVAVTLKRTGKVTDSSLLSKRPPSGVVTDQSSWESLWSAWRAGQEIPKVDFQSQIVLVATAQGPSTILTSSLRLTPSGDLRYEAVSRNAAGPGFGYALLIIPKDGILSVNGQKLAGQQPAAQPAAQKLTGQELAGQEPVEQKLLEQNSIMKPVMKPDGRNLSRQQPVSQPPTPRLGTPITKASDIDESIWVEIQGRVKNFRSRDESNRVMVAANGIVWELNLRDDPQLIKAVQQLDTGIGNIKGTLSQSNNPDRSKRYIVDVTSIGPVSTRQDRLTQRLVQSEPAQFPPSKIEPLQFNGTKTDSGAGEKLPMSQPEISQTGFKSIVISLTGGQSTLERKQIVAADGSVTMEVPKTNYSESFSLSADSLSKLHRFVASADWRSVPRDRGSSDKSVTSYSITIETENGTLRFFTDDASVGSQPIISELFSLMQKPKNNP